MSEKIDLQKMYDEGKLKPGDKWIAQRPDSIYFLCYSKRNGDNGYFFENDDGIISQYQSNGYLVGVKENYKASRLLYPAPRKIKYDFWLPFHIKDDGTSHPLCFPHDGELEDARVHFTGEFTEGEGLEPCTSPKE